MTGEASYGTDLAEFAAGPLAVPSAVVQATKRAVLDSVGVALAGSRHAASRIVVNGLLGRADGPSTIIGSELGADPVSAALANGVMAHVLDFDDTILPTRLHASAALVPALLAVAEERGLGGDRLIESFAVGFEIQARLAEATYPEFAEAGWHGTGIFGGIGAAAAVGRLIGLDEARMTHALGIAATGASGLMAVFGSMSKALNIGRAAATGVQSAALAEAGFTASAAVFRGDRSFLHLYSAQPRVEAMLAGLGSEWAVLRNGFKPYPCGVVGHAAIDAVRALRQRASTDQPLRLRLMVSRETMRLMGTMDPRDELEAKFSVRYAAAAAWIDGTVGPDSFDDDRVHDPEVRAVMSVTDVEVDPAMPQHAARGVVEMAGGREDREDIMHARGMSGRPLTDDELMEKFRLLATGREDVDRLLELLGALETTDIRELVSNLRSGGRK